MKRKDKKKFGYTIIKKRDLDDLEQQLKAKDKAAQAAPKKISDLENVINRKNNKIIDLENEKDLKNHIIKQYERSTGILEKNNNKLIENLSRSQEREELQKIEIQELKEKNKEKDQEIRSLVAKSGGLTKQINEQQIKLNNYKEMFKKNHVTISPSEYDNRIKTVEQKKKKLEK